MKTGSVPSGYVEDLSDARTKLADFFSILHYSGISITYDVATPSFSWDMETIET